MKNLAEIIQDYAKTPASQEPIANPFDLIATLTPEEQAYHLEYATSQAQRAYAFRLQSLGASREEIVHKLAARDWTISEEEKQAILVFAANRKQWAQEEAEERERKKRFLIERMERLRAQWTAEAFIQVIRDHYKAKHGEVKIVAGQDRYFRALAYKLSGDPRLESEMGMNPQRGLLILGDPGLGKTETLNAVRNNPLAPIRIVSILEITDHVKETGFCDLRLDRITVIDDIGNEPVPVKYYGTEINWFKDFIEMAYLKNVDFRNLIITTNLGANHLQNLYGYRVRSRLREMFNVISLNGEDLRQ
jgi:DNA replication protein DnaC